MTNAQYLVKKNGVWTSNAIKSEVAMTDEEIDKRLDELDKRERSGK